MYKIMVNLPERQYPIEIEKGILEEIGKKIKEIYKNKKIAIITDSNVEKLYGHKIEDQFIKENFIVKKIIIKPGEKSKCFHTLQEVCEEILEFGLGRGDLILTFGGGVVGDLGGFAASILLRGVPFIQIPTTLLAQVDSSVGGKVAIDSKQGKNLIGSFYQPKAVFIDPEVLNTLSERQFNDGMAEVIKYGAISEKNLFRALLKYKDKQELMEHMEEVIYTCVAIKRDFVEQDEKDLGERMMLNFGHTIGHGIEKVFHYETYTHGEAVAMGMAVITKNSEKLGFTEEGTFEQIVKLIKKYNLPNEFPSLKEEELLKAVQLDKKKVDQTMNLILLKKIGEAFIHKVQGKEIEKFLSKE